jgi:hypothetical protein
MEKSLDKDSFSIACHDGISMEDGRIMTVEDSGDIGELFSEDHFDDFMAAQRKQLSRQEAKHDPFLPQERLVKIVDYKGLKCPALSCDKKNKKNRKKKK